jgi:integrase
MPTKKLTVPALATLPPGDWFDTVLPGLSLRVGKNRRAWSCRYRGGGRYQRRPLGYYPAMGLSEARDAARKLIERVDSGAPPASPVPHPRSSSALTLGTLLNRYETVRLREGHRIKTFPKTMRALRRHFRPWLGLPAGEFTKSDLRSVRDRMVEAGTVIEANRLLAVTGALMKWAAQEDLIPVNFVSAIRKSPEQKRERVLSKAEIKAIWHACEALGSSEVMRNYGRLARFLLLTAQRRSEVAALRYGHIIDHTWRQTENKASRPHSLPLPALALTLVGRGEARDLVFRGRDGKINCFSLLKRRLDKVSGVTGWRLHDLRRSAASHMQDLGVRNDIVQGILNHSLPGVAGVYLRAELEKQKADALAAWAVALTKIVGPLRVTA